MIAFWITTALMLLMGFLLFVPALRKQTRNDRPSRAQLNLALYRQRQQELAAETGSAEALQNLSAESERHLLADLESTHPPLAPTAQNGRRALLIGLLLVPLLAGLTYALMGRPDLISQPPQVDSSQAEIRKSIEGLAQRLQQNPNDLEGWVLLGRSLQATQEPERATQAFEFALKLAPDNLDLKSYYAEALAEAQQGSMQGRPAGIGASILKQNPQHKTALWLAGVAAAERGDLKTAVHHWQALKAQFPAESPEAQEIAGFIGKATAEAGTATAPAPTTAGKQIRVKVALADALKPQAQPDDTVFIFARAAEGPPMPLAVVRKQVKDLPLEVTLDDSQSMVQGMNVSAFERLVIGARVSKSGRPIPSPGDLEGLTNPVTPAMDARYSITINHIVPEQQR